MVDESKPSSRVQEMIEYMQAEEFVYVTGRTFLLAAYPNSENADLFDEMLDQTLRAMREDTFAAILTAASRFSAAMNKEAERRRFEKDNDTATQQDHDLAADDGPAKGLKC